jgi:hypothetical protein
MGSASGRGSVRKDGVGAVLRLVPHDVTVSRPGWMLGKPRFPLRDPRRLRRAQPSNVLHPHTVDWILGLPARIRPHILAVKYGRIANQLCGLWHDPDACVRYFDDLLTDKRGGRAGFAPWLRKEIVELRDFYAQLHPTRR